ncbi:MAG: hypothetical protein K6E86_00105 [Bacteroidales bacterium]|nr:hypothetical protein [Bacteroidales bacterium]
MYLFYDALLADAKAMRYACGMSRSFLLGAIATELLEMRQLLLSALRSDNKGCSADDDVVDATADIQPDNLCEMGDEVCDAIEQCTANHALMTCNRRPAHSTGDCELYSPGFRYSGLSYADQSAQLTEQHLYRTMLDALQDVSLDVSAIESCPFPLCELSILLANEVKDLAHQLAHQRQLALAYARQRTMADDHDPQLATYINRTIEAGFMTPSAQWEANVTRSQIAYWVSLAALRLKISRQWKWALDRWGIDNLAQENNRNISGRYIPRKSTIDGIFR